MAMGLCPDPAPRQVDFQFPWHGFCFFDIPKIGVGKEKYLMENA